MTGKKKIGKAVLAEELNALMGQVTRLQKRTARSGVPHFVWDSILGIQNVVQDALDNLDCWED